MSQIFRGTFNPQQQRYQITYSPTSGYIREWDYKGFSEALMSSLMSTYTAQGAEAILTGEHGIYTLHVRDGTGAVTLDTWQIAQQDERPSSLQNPRVRSLIAAVPGNADTITEDIAKVLNGDTVTIDGTSYDYTALKTYFTTSPTINEPAARLMERMKKGSTEFTRSTYILRHTTNASQAYLSNVADFNVDKIYTTAQLLTETLNGTYWLLPLPGEIEYAIRNTIVFPYTRANYMNGWLKRGPSRVTAANFRIEISTEYWAGQISTDEYDFAANP